MFPTIYGIALNGLGNDGKIASAGLVMAIVGGALTPPLQGIIIGQGVLFSIPAVNDSFVLPLIFAVISFYGYQVCRKHIVIKWKISSCLNNNISMPPSWQISTFAKNFHCCNLALSFPFCREPIILPFLTCVVMQVLDMGPAFQSRLIPQRAFLYTKYPKEENSVRINNVFSHGAKILALKDINCWNNC